MSVTVNDVLLNTYYRRGDRSVPSDSNELARGLSFVSDAYRDLLRRNNYWFAQKVEAFQTVDGKSIYSLPDDYKSMSEVRYNDDLVTRQSYKSSFNIDLQPAYLGYTGRWYYIYNNELHMTPEASETPTSHSITSISVSDTVATVTTSTEHGFQNDYYVEIVGCGQAELNGNKRVTSLTTTTFSFVVVTGTTGETPTATATRNNLTFKYFYDSSDDFTDVSDVINIPVQYKGFISAYVFGRLAQMDGEKGDAQDGFNEANDIAKRMNINNMNRQVAQSGVSGIW